MKGLVLLAVLLATTEFAVAQNPEAPPSKRSHAERSMPLRLLPSRLPPPRPTHASAPAAIPEQFAPPQEAYAAFPEAVAAGAPVAAKPTDCDLRLAKIATFRPLPVLVGPGECGASDAVLLDSVILADHAEVTVTPPATLRCTMAEAVAIWLREDVAPAAQRLGAPLRGLDNFDSYECRGRNRVRGATLSEHGRANALDIRGFRLANGEQIELTDVNVAKDWREALRGTACARFSTVLGPGADGNHEQHVHLDLAERRGDYKMCEWEVREPPKQPEQTVVGPTITEAAKLDDAVPLPRPRPVANADDAQAKKVRAQLR